MRVLLVLAISIFCFQLSYSQNVIYSDSFDKTSLGQSPKEWISNRKCAIEKVKNTEGHWLKLRGLGTYVLPLNKNLPDSFTLSFDFIYHSGGDGNNVTELTLFALRDSDNYDEWFPGSNGLKLNLENFVVSYMCYNNVTHNDQRSKELRIGIIDADTRSHIEIWVKKADLLIKINNRIIFNELNVIEPEEKFNALRFHLRESLTEPWIGNIRITQ